MYRYRMSRWSKEEAGAVSRADRLNERLREPGAVATLYCLSYLLFLALGLLLFRQRPDGSILIICLSPCLSTLLSRYTSMKQERLARLERFFDRPAAVEQIPVRVLYRKGSFVYGRDVGVATLVNGCLSFEGEQSRFSVPQNVDSWCSWTNERVFGSSIGSPRCSIHVAGDDLTIECHFIDRLYGGKNASSGFARYTQFTPVHTDAIRHWDSLPPTPDTEFMVPPTVPSRQEFRVLRRQLYPCILCAICVLFTWLLEWRTGDARAWRQADAAACIFSIVAVWNGSYWWWRRRGLLKISKAGDASQVQVAETAPVPVVEGQHVELAQAETTKR